jgi:hypothetical protein
MLHRVRFTELLFCDFGSGFSNWRLEAATIQVERALFREGML